MKRLIGLLVVIFIANVGQVFALDCTETNPNHAAGAIIVGSVTYNGVSYCMEVQKKDINKGSRMDWAGAIKGCNTSRELGVSNWVVPNKEELTMIYKNLAEGKADNGGFDNSDNSSYWSSSECEPDPIIFRSKTDSTRVHNTSRDTNDKEFTWAWFLHFSNSFRSGELDKCNKAGTLIVRCTRAF